MVQSTLLTMSYLRFLQEFDRWSSFFKRFDEPVLKIQFLYQKYITSHLIPDISSLYTLIIQKKTPTLAYPSRIRDIHGRPEVRART